MNYSILIIDDGKARYEEMLKAAEAERRYRQIKGNSPSLLQRAGGFLIAAGQKLKAQPYPTTPAFHSK